MHEGELCPARAIVTSGLCVCAVVVWIREHPQMVSMVMGNDGWRRGRGDIVRVS